MANKIVLNILDNCKKTARAIGRFNTLILLTLFYYLFFLPFGLILKLFRHDPLRSGSREKKKKTNWQEVDVSNPDLKSLKRQS